MTNGPLTTDNPTATGPSGQPQPALPAERPRRRAAPTGTMYADQEPVEPVTDNWDWQLFAACRGMDVDIFYHPWGERSRRRVDRIDRAKKICRQCPVILECAKYALEAREPYGVWGGLSEDDRVDLLGRKRRGQRTSNDGAAPEQQSTRNR